MSEPSTEPIDSSETAESAGTQIWAVDPPQDIRIAGWEWESAVVFASGPGDTHSLSHLAALTLQILTEGARSEHDLLTELEPHLPAEERAGLPPALADILKELQRIGLVRRSTPKS